MAGRKFVVLMTDEQIDLLLEEKLNVLPSQVDAPPEAQIRALVLTEFLPILQQQIADRFARK